MKILVLVILFGGTLLAQSTTRHLSGEIKGTVVDESGTPISSATVYAVAQGLTLNDVTPQSVKADSNGLFDFRGTLKLGGYKLYAEKDDNGYLDPFDPFYSDNQRDAPQVDLSREHLAAIVALKMGKPAAVVSGRIVDAESGAHLKASLGFLDVEGHGHSVVVDGDYSIALPSEKDITLMVTLFGSKADRSLIPMAPLRLEPGQRVYMDIPIRSR